MDKLEASILGIDNKPKLVNSLIEKNIKQIHYDLMDGFFVESTSLSVEEIIDIVSKTKKHIVDVHLMKINPINDIIKIKNIADFITFHIEAVNQKQLNDIFNLGIKNIGIAINPDTNVETVFKYADKVSHFLVMSVFPGKGGQSFINESLKKINILKNKFPNLTIQVDGGINLDTAKAARLSGADSLVSGSFLLNNIDNEDIVKKLK